MVVIFDYEDVSSVIWCLSIFLIHQNGIIENNMFLLSCIEYFLFSILYIRNIWLNTLLVKCLLIFKYQIFIHIEWNDNTKKRTKTKTIRNKKNNVLYRILASQHCIYIYICVLNSPLNIRCHLRTWSTFSLQKHPSSVNTKSFSTLLIAKNT